MPTDPISGSGFADVLRTAHLLSPAQLDELTRDLQLRFPEARALVAELIRCDWLTPYQANQLLQGRGGDLLLGSYVLLESIGEGGMGQVFKARNRKLGRVVALKVVRQDRLDRPEVVDRFRREIRAAGQLSHPNVVHAFDAGEAGGVFFFAMELMTGADLACVVKERGPLPVREACEYIRQAALGLQHAHERGLVHRDVKPSNLLLTADGVVKVLDLGLARLNRRSETGQDSSTLTQHGTLMGSLDYIAPEQAKDSHAVDARADLYSLGCTFYYLLTGRPPFPGGAMAAKLAAHLFEEPEPLAKRRPDAPPAVVAGVRKLMAKNPADRYQTAAEVAAALAACCARPAAPSAAAMDTQTLECRAADGATVSPPPRRRGGRRVVWLGVAGGAVLLLAALIALLAWFGRAPPARPADAPEGKVAWAPGPPLGMLPGLIARPARLPGIRRWQVETQWPRFPISGVSWSPDGKLIAYADWGGRIRLIDAETRRLVQLLPGHEGGVTCVAWSPDGAWLASGGWGDKAVRLWRPDGTRGPVLTGHKSGVNCIAWSPDGKRLASGGHWGDSTVRIWSVDGARGPVLPHDTIIDCVAWSPDGHVLATTDSAKQLIRLWNTSDGTPLTTLGPLPGILSALAWSPDGKYLASNGGEFFKEHVAGWIWNVAESKKAAPLPSAGDSWTNWLGWSAESGLASVTQDERVVLYDPRSGARVADTRYSEGMGSASWSPDGRRIAASNGQIFAVNRDRRQITPTGFQPRREEVLSVAWNPDGKRLASSGISVRLWDANGTPGPMLKTNAGCYIPSVAWSPDGTRLAATTGGNETTVRLWNADGSAGPVLRGHESDVDGVAWSPDGKRLASASRDKTVRLWDADGTAGPVLRSKEVVLDKVAWSSDGKRLAAAGEGGIIQLWDADGEAGLVLRGHEGWVNGLAWNPRGERLASAGSDGTVRLWNKDGSPGPVLTGNEGRVLAVAWSPDGKRLASANEHGTVRLWDADGTPGPVLRGHEGEVWSVAWSADGERLASAGRTDSTLRVWDADGETEWMAMLLPDGNAAVFSAAGELLHGDPDSAEHWLVYLVEQDDGHIAYLQPSAFRERLAAAEKEAGR